jgi:hypothetical protein
MITMGRLILKTLLHPPPSNQEFTHDCVATFDSNSIMKFADDITLVGLITNGDETAYREEVRDLAVWCQDNKLSLNVSKPKEPLLPQESETIWHGP